MEALLKKQALDNLWHHPTNYARNWIANLGRLWFNFPYSYTQQKLSTYFYILPNTALLLMLIPASYLAIVSRRFIPQEIYVLMLLASLTFAAGSLLSAQARHLLPIVPFLFLLLAITYGKATRIKIKDIIRR